MTKSPEHFVIEGGRRLEGTVHISGAKNLVLPAMAASLLTEEDCFLENVPLIDDVDIMADILRTLGATVDCTGDHILRINAAKIHSHDTPTELVIKNRASFLVMGPLLARFGEAGSAAPGGDLIGQRPIDVHLTGFRALGAEITRRNEIHWARSANLRGTRIFMDYPSHTGTENLLMAATLAKGETTLQNASSEPEVIALTQMLNQMGAKIKGAGTRTIQIEGVPELKGTTFSIIPDRIEAGTYAIAAAITQGEIILEPAINDHLDALWWKLRHAGVEVVENDSNILIRGSKELTAVDVETLPFPGFPTDLQPIMGILLTQAKGVSILREMVYDNRLLYISELRKMGAETVTAASHTALIGGPTKLIGARVYALDIRSGAALILAGLVASGQTYLDWIYHLDRGYENIDEKLRGLGAKIERKTN